ncbi:hypothetical protein [Streptantibioticus silvisoli]|uniref:Thioesterase domain-containing protein n=1 Tax=Streptantibioticus silvisoli TaxID=2705255 RepID=A0ABT6VYN5_9ACTN|nr:hypothetical protein [Streptantibioticus silvisoli]MDI5962391.1 hypothetical protein [Streptantibioticus silvisoli]
MSTPQSWQILSGEEGESDLVLAVDFFAPGRPEASFVDLASHLSPSQPVWLASQPAGLPYPLGPDDYVEWWMRDIRESGRTVKAVSGFCAGSVFAGELYRRICDEQETKPRLIVFDPEAMHPFGIYMQYHKQVDRYAGLLSPERIAAAQRDGQALLQKQSQPVALGQELMALHRKVALEVFRESGIDEEYGDEVLELFGSLITYMVAAAQVDTAKSWAEATVLTSSTPGSGAEQAETVLAFDVDRYELLRDRGAAAAVSELLAKRPG